METDIKKTKFQQSSIGLLIDVATPGSLKLILSIAIWATVTFLLAICNLSLFYNLGQIDFLFVVFVTPLSLFVIWFGLGTIVQRISTLFSERCYFRAGKRGISFNMVDNRFKPIMLFQPKMRQVDLLWQDIHEWYPYSLVIAYIIPVSTYIFIRTKQNEKILIPTSGFKESQKQIVDNIMNAQSIGL